MFSSKCDKKYLARVQRESDRMVEDDPVVALDSPQLEYAISKTQNNCVSKVIDHIPNMKQ